MTCIVSWRDPDGAYNLMAGDSALTGNSNSELIGSGQSKVFALRVGTEQCVIGVSGEMSISQFIRFGPPFPAAPETTDDSELIRWVVNDVCASIRNHLMERKCLKIENGVVDMGACLLLGFRGRNFEIGNKFGAKSTKKRHDSIGFAYPFAIGALDMSEGSGDTEMRLLRALEIAADNNPTVRPPYMIIDSRTGIIRLLERP